MEEGGAVIDLRVVSLEDEEPIMTDMARQMLLAAKVSGAIPEDRADIVGTEFAVFAMDGPSYVGMATFYEPEPCLYWLDVLYVLPAYRRRGIGRQMVEAVVAEAREAGAATVQCGTMASNSAMHALAAQVGLAKTIVYFSMPVASSAGAIA